MVIALDPCTTRKIYHQTGLYERNEVESAHFPECRYIIITQEPIFKENEHHNKLVNHNFWRPAVVKKSRQDLKKWLHVFACNILEFDKSAPFALGQNANC